MKEGKKVVIEGLTKTETLDKKEISSKDEKRIKKIFSKRVSFSKPINIFKFYAFDHMSYRNGQFEKMAKFGLPILENGIEEWYQIVKENEELTRSFKFINGSKLKRIYKNEIARLAILSYELNI